MPTRNGATRAQLEEATAAAVPRTPLSPPASPLPSASSPNNNIRINVNAAARSNRCCWHPAVLERTVSYVKQDFASIVATSPILQTAPSPESHIALFARHEIITSSPNRRGPPIGKGGFSVVYEIVDFELDANITAQLSPVQAQLRRTYQQQVRETATTTTTTTTTSADAVSRSNANDGSGSGSSRFVLKHLQERLLAQPQAFACAASDLAVEAAYMSTLDHPHICKVRGLPVQGLDAFFCSSSNSNGDDHDHDHDHHSLHDAYFIILDRLHDTLDQCIKREQQQQQQQQQEQQNLLLSSMNNNSNSISNSTSNWNSLMNSSLNSNSTTTTTTRTKTLRLSLSRLENKTRLAMQIAQALSYLHERRIVFRDLKPSNIGLDRFGNIQLFDFGLCRELPRSSSSALSLLSITPCMTPSCHNINTDNVVDHGDDNDDYYADFCCRTIDESHHYETGGGGTAAAATAAGYCDEVFEMSGVGTRRYMAVEIINTRRYNCKADVYSFAMVLYEMLTLQKPFATYSMEDHQLFACQNGERPALHQRLLYKSHSHSSSTNNTNTNNNPHESSSLAVRKMIAKVLEQSWCESVCNRFDIHQVCRAMTDILRAMNELSHKNSIINNVNNNINNISSSNDNSIGSTSVHRPPISVATPAASIKITDQQPDSPVGVNDIRLLFPSPAATLEHYHPEEYSSDCYDNDDSAGDHEYSLSASIVTTTAEEADFRDDSPTTTWERQGQEILLLLRKKKKKKAAAVPPSTSSSPSVQGGAAAAAAASIPSHLFLPDIEPLLISHVLNNEEVEEEELDEQDVHGDDDDEREEEDDDDLRNAADEGIGGMILYRQSSYGHALL